MHTTQRIPSLLVLFLALGMSWPILPSCKKSSGGGSSPISFSPASDTVGGIITLTGNVFGSHPETDVVLFSNDLQTVLISSSPTQLTVAVPPGATNGKILVKLYNGFTYSTLAHFTVAPKFTPAMEGVGYPVTLSGINFSTTLSANLVKFNGTNAVVTASSGTMLTVTVPPGATDGPISVTIGGQTFTTLTNFTVTPTGVVSTLAGSGNAGSSNATGSAASFNQPEGLAVDNSGNVYVADYNNNMIRMITPAGVVSNFAGNGIGTDADGPKFSASFYAPSSLVIVGDTSKIFVTDMLGNRVREISNGMISTLSNNTTINYSIYFLPMGISADASGDLFFANEDYSDVAEISAAGIAKVIAGPADLGAPYVAGTIASFYRPVGTAVDQAGNVYVADMGNNRIYKISASGVVSTFAGGSTITSSGDGQGTSAGFSQPSALAFDSNGNLYVADGGNNAIRRITPSGMVSTVAGGAGRSVSADGTGTSAGFASPAGIAVDKNGTIYVSDAIGNKIRKITLH